MSRPLRIGFAGAKNQWGQGNQWGQTPLILELKGQAQFKGLDVAADPKSMGSDLS